MTKGRVGDLIRESLVADGVLTPKGEMYHLDPDRLGSVVGATYHDLNIKQFNDQVRRYLAAALDREAG